MYKVSLTVQASTTTPPTTVETLNPLLTLAILDVSPTIEPDFDWADAEILTKIQNDNDRYLNMGDLTALL